MSLSRSCLFCGEPVSIRRRMSLFCSDRCEIRHRYVERAQRLPATDAGSYPSRPRMPEGALPAAPAHGRMPMRP